MTPTHCICRPYNEAERDVAVTYGAVDLVADCGHRVWVAASTVRGMFGTDTKTMCTPCALVFAALNGPPSSVSTYAGADEELTQIVGVAQADQIMAQVREYGSRDEQA